MTLEQLHNLMMRVYKADKTWSVWADTQGMRVYRNKNGITQYVVEAPATARKGRPFLFKRIKAWEEKTDGN